MEKVEENLIKKTCKDLGITQKELAEKLGISRQTVSDWARGSTKISKLTTLLLRLLVSEQDCNKFKETILNMNIQKI